MRVSCGNRGGVVVVPVVVEPVKVPVPPVAVPVEVTDVEVAVPVAVMYEAPSIPLLIEYSPSCIESGILNAIAPRTKYLHFFELAYRTLFQALSAPKLRQAGVTGNTPADMKTGFGSGKP